MEKGRRRSRGMSTLEKCLIVLFVLMTGACIALLVLYFIDKDDSAEGEFVYVCLSTILLNMLQYCADATQLNGAAQ